MTRPVIHRKLVRDHIPEIVRAAGKTPWFAKLSKHPERLNALRRKLLEESYELFQADSSQEFIKEAADVLQVLQSIAREMDIPWDRILTTSSAKREERGAFLEGIFLHAVSRSLDAEAWIRLPRELAGEHSGKSHSDG